MEDWTWHKLLDGVGSNDPGNPTEHGRNSEQLSYIYIEGTKTKHTNIKREREREWLVLVIMVTEARKKHKALRLQFFLP
jgi:hypothetical protein